MLWIRERGIRVVKHIRTHAHPHVHADTDTHQHKGEVTLYIRVYVSCWSAPPLLASKTEHSRPFVTEVNVYIMTQYLFKVFSAWPQDRHLFTRAFLKPTSSTWPLCFFNSFINTNIVLRPEPMIQLKQQCLLEQYFYYCKTVSLFSIIANTSYTNVARRYPILLLPLFPCHRYCSYNNVSASKNISFSLSNAIITIPLSSTTSTTKTSPFMNISIFFFNPNLASPALTLAQRILNNSKKVHFLFLCLE